MKSVLTMPCMWCDNSVPQHRQRIEIMGLMLIRGQLRGYYARHTTKQGTVFQYGVRCEMNVHFHRTRQECSWANQGVITFLPWDKGLFDENMVAYETVLPGVHNTRGLHNLKEK